MQKEIPVILSEIRKRPPEKPLNLGELIVLRDIPYQDLKNDVSALQLMIKYCQNRKQRMNKAIHT